MNAEILTDIQIGGVFFVKRKSVFNTERSGEKEGVTEFHFEVLCLGLQLAPVQIDDFSMIETVLQFEPGVTGKLDFASQGIGNNTQNTVELTCFFLFQIKEQLGGFFAEEHFKWLDFVDKGHFFQT